MSDQPVSPQPPKEASTSPSETRPSPSMSPASAGMPLSDGATSAAASAPGAGNVAPVPTAASAIAASQPSQPWVWGTGRRKTAVARVRIRTGAGKFLVHDREVNEYFLSEQTRLDVVAPLRATQTLGKFDVVVNVHGGGQEGQAGAIVLGVARALVKADPNLEPILRDGKYLTRDSRKVERKKPGRPGARRRFQFSKR